MAANPLPDGQDKLFTLAEDMADGLHEMEVFLEVKQNTEAELRAAVGTRKGLREWMRGLIYLAPLALRRDPATTVFGMLRLAVILLVVQLFVCSAARAEVLNLYPIADATISEGNPDAEYGDKDALTIGDLSGTWRTLIAWDIAGEPGLLGAKINSATLYLTWGSGSIQPLTFVVGKNDSNWSEATVNWNNAPKATVLLTGGTTVNPASLPVNKRVAVNDSGAYLKNWLQDILDNKIQNYGIRIEPASPPTGVFHNYVSRHASGQAQRPFIKIDYTPAPPTVGTVAATLNGIAGEALPENVQWNIGGQTGSGTPATITGVVPGSQRVLASHQTSKPPNQNPWQERERWIDQSDTFTSGPQNRSYTRNLPYAGSGVVFPNGTSYVPGQSVPIRVPVKNDSPSSLSMTVRVVISRSSSLDGADYDQTSAATMVAANNPAEIELPPFVPAAEGTYLTAYRIQTTIDGTTTTTDTGAWGSAIEAKFKNTLEGTVSHVFVAEVGLETFPVSIWPVKSGPIRPDIRTWVVVHGRVSSRNDPGIARLAIALQNLRTNDQVLTLDWSAAADESWADLGYHEDIIPIVSDWAANALKQYGFVTSNLNLVGHSWGANVSSGISDRFFGGVDTIIALDPARHGAGSYNPDVTVNFARNSNYSWAFHSSVYGSQITVGTADEAFNVLTTYGPELFVSQVAAHSAPLSVLADMLERPLENPVAAYFELKRLLAHSSGPWLLNQFYPLPLITGFEHKEMEAEINCDASNLVAVLPLNMVAGDEQQGPTVAVTSHANLQTVTVPTITLAGTASDFLTGNSGIRTVTVRDVRTGNELRAVNDFALASRTANWSRKVDLASGTNVFVITSEDDSAARNTTAISLRIVYSSTDPLAPNLVIGAPADGMTVTTASVVVSGTASDGGRGNNGVTVTVNDVVADGGTANGNGTANWSRTVSLNTGANAITVAATDSNRNATNKTLTVFYAPGNDTNAPNLTIIAPADGTVVLSSTVPVTGTASDGGRGDNGVTVKVNDVVTMGGTAVGGGTAIWSRTVNLNVGANTITVVATDSKGNPTSQTRTLNYSTNQPPVGLVADYHFDGTAEDASGNGLNGLASGVTWLVDRNGTPNSAALFDGNAGFITIKDPQGKLNFEAKSDNYSIVTWVKFSAIPDKVSQSLLMDRNGDNSHYSYYFGYSDALKRFFWQTWDGKDVVGVNSTIQPLPGVWYHVAIVMNQGRQRMYVNGADETQPLANNGVVGPNYLSTKNSDAIVNIGRYSGTPPNFLNGALDDVRIYSKALSVGEVLALARKETGLQVRHNRLAQTAEITLVAYPNTPYSLQAVSDLKDIWSDLLGQTHTTDSLGVTIFTVPLSNSSNRFYRVQR